VAPAQDQPHGDERVGQVLAHEIEPEDVEDERQENQDERGDQRNSDQLEPAKIGASG
jgi:hypothetical protein